MSYELIPAVDHAEKLIRDAKDQPILNAAIVSDVDVILTGDKDFLSLDMEHPKCMTAAQFFEYEGVEELHMHLFFYISNIKHFNQLFTVKVFLFFPFKKIQKKW